MPKPSGPSGATPTAANRRAVDFRRQLDTHTRTLVESFGGLLRSAKITNPQSTAREEFQINVATASLSTAGEGLLRQIREVKLAVMLQDEPAMDREVDQALAKIAQERGELVIELEALSNDLKAAYAKAAMGGSVETPLAQEGETEEGEEGKEGNGRGEAGGAEKKVKEEEEEGEGEDKEAVLGGGDGMDVVKELEEEKGVAATGAGGSGPKKMEGVR